MILVLDPVNQDLHDDLHAAMLEMRARSTERFGILIEGMEKTGQDEFDGLDPTNVICLSDKGQVVGSLRLLQTTGAHMLSDLMAGVLNGDFSIRSPHVWECSRIEIDPDLGGPFSLERMKVLAELFIAVIDIAREAAVTDLLTIYDDHLEKLMRGVGVEPYEIMGRLNQGRDRYFAAGLIDCTEQRQQKIRFLSNISGDVRRSDLEAREFIDEISAGSTRKGRGVEGAKIAMQGSLTDGQRLEFARFYLDQMDVAQTDEKRQEAFELLRMVITS